MNSLFDSVIRRGSAAANSLFDRIAGSHDYRWLAHFYDLTEYACWVAGALFLAFLLLRRKPVGFIGLAALLVAALIGGTAYWLRDNIEYRVGIGRLEALSAMRLRPADPWPRGTSHAVLGRMGASEWEKAYLEPGGSFSPAAGSFGVSFWVMDRSGRLMATSDDIPLEQTRSAYAVSRSGEPAIRTETPYYVLLLTARDDGSLQLEIETSKVADTSIQVVFRGVGPAAGPLRTIEFSGQKLQVGEAWAVQPVTPDQLSYMGSEGATGWKGAASNAPHHAVRDKAGWAVARIKVERQSTLNFQQSKASGPAPLPHVNWPLEIGGVDGKFADSLQSQVMTLAMGLVGQEARPGEPLNYPLEWLRDGAYIIVALARAGQHEIATRLALAAASKDFFGGFGAEGDSPGLGIWVLAETAAVVRDPDFDKAIWPHIERKIGLIQRMMQPQPFTSDFVGPIVRKVRNRTDLRAVTEAPRYGLIDGRMDLHRPLFYVNAATYAGLLDASRVAERLGKAELAKEWAVLAANLRVAWNAAFLNPALSSDVQNERTAISGLWLSDVADRPAYERMMNSRWEREAASWDDPGFVPLWSYFSVAEAHQWLRLDNAGRLWKILNHLWSRPRFPDLYLLWEGDAEENSSGRWGPMRGWLLPPHVVPHYWSAAEMLLLQLAMIAEVRRAGPTEELVIGAGFPPEWLSRTLRFKGIGTSAGVVDWTWNGEMVSVTVSPPSSLPIRLGNSFPPGTRIEIKSP